MDKVKGFVTKVLATWVGIGSALLALGATGLINVPGVLTELFSAGTAQVLQETFDIVIQAIGAVITAAQVIRAIFIAKESGGEVKVLDAKAKKAFAWSPFKSL